MLRLAVRGAVKMMPGSTATWPVPTSLVVSMVLRACADPGWTYNPGEDHPAYRDPPRNHQRLGQPRPLGCSCACLHSWDRNPDG
jgi:hypothetical protein